MHWKFRSHPLRFTTLVLAGLLALQAISSDSPASDTGIPPTRPVGTDRADLNPPRLRVDTRCQQLWLEGVAQGTAYRLLTAPSPEGPWKEIGSIGSPDQPFRIDASTNHDPVRFYRVELSSGVPRSSEDDDPDPADVGAGRDWDSLMESVDRSTLWLGASGVGRHGEDGGVPTVTVAASPVAMPERGGAGGFVLRRTPPLDQALEVFFELRGSAANGGDYRWIPNRITFPPGAAEVRLPVWPIADGLDEPDEEIRLHVERSADHAISVGSAQIRLLDSDLPVVRLSVVDGMARRCLWKPLDSAEVEIRREGRLESPLKVILRVSGSAASGRDFLAIAPVHEIPAGQNSIRVPVVPIHPGLTNGPLRVTLTAEGSVAYRVEPQGANASVSLLNSISSVVTVTAPDPEAVEGATPPNPGVFRFTRTGDLSEPLRVFYRVGGTAQGVSTESTPDYPALSGEILIPAGRSEESIVVTPHADPDLESQETVTVVLTGSIDYQIGPASEATLRIEDPAPNRLMGRTLASTASPGLGTAALIEVTRLGRTSQPLTVPIEVLGRRRWQSVWQDFKSVPAWAGGSYVLLVDGQPSTVLTFPRGVSKRTVGLRAVHPVTDVPAATVVIDPNGSLPIVQPVRFIDPANVVTLSASASHVVEGGTWSVRLRAQGPTPGGTVVQLTAKGDLRLADCIVTGAAVSPGGQGLVATIPSWIPGKPGGEITIGITPRRDSLVTTPPRHLALVFDQKQTGACLPGSSQQRPYVAVRVSDSTDASRPPVDVDSDHLPDDFEIPRGLDPFGISHHVGDADRDGLGDREEFLRGTDPESADPDGDGLNDFLEGLFGLEPSTQDASRIDVGVEWVPIRLRTAGAFREGGEGCYRCHAPGMRVGGLELTEKTATTGSGSAGLLERIVLVKPGSTHPIQLLPPEEYRPTTVGQSYDAEVLPVRSGPPGFVVLEGSPTLLGRSRTADATTFTRTATLRVPPAPRLGVDADRDGTVRFDTTDATSLGAPYRFWINNDSDVGDQEQIPVRTPDHVGARIQGVRDVEDLTRLWIALDGTDDLWAMPGFRLALEWRRVHSGQPAIQLFSAGSWKTGGRQYLETLDGAREQAGLTVAGNDLAISDEKSGDPLLKPGRRLVLPARQMASDRRQGPRRHLVFEGVSTGQGELVALLLFNGQVVCESAPLHLRLLDVREMYSRGQGGPVDAFDPPFRYAETQPPALAMGLAPWLPQLGHQVDPEEDPLATVFIHGWNLSDSESSGLSDTLFKRLWHSGYRGRFCAFRWPTTMLEEPFLSDSFNVGEHRALEYGAALRILLAGLPAGYRCNLIAHSQGGMVAVSALRSGAVVENSLMLQTAVPASVVDPGRHLDWMSLAVTDFRAPEGLATPDWFETDGGYRGMLGAVDTRLINYFNESDFALQTGRVLGVAANWIENQLMQKPHWPGLSDFRRYAWIATAPAAPLDLRPRYALQANPHRMLRPVIRAHEILAFIARSRSRALGAEPRARGLLHPGSGVDLTAAPFAVGATRDDHSATFTRSLPTAWPIISRMTQDLERL